MYACACNVYVRVCTYVYSVCVHVTVCRCVLHARDMIFAGGEVIGMNTLKARAYLVKAQAAHDSRACSIA